MYERARAETGDLWIFGYGSLMWDPGFPHMEARPALLRGYHRAFCVYSVRYRGTPERPGLVLGLAPGGSCRGRAFLVAAERRLAVLDYLEEREMSHYVYRPRFVALELAGRKVEAFTHVACPDHRSYCGGLPAEEVAAIIAAGRGERGPNRDYLVNTLAHLDEMGVHDKSLARLCELVGLIGGEP